MPQNALSADGLANCVDREAARFNAPSAIRILISRALRSGFFFVSSETAGLAARGSSAGSVGGNSGIGRGAADPVLSNDGSPKGFMRTITVKGRSVTVVKGTLGRRPGAVPVDKRQDLASRLDQIEERIKRLTVSRRDPDRFFEQRSEIADDVRKLALELRC